MAEIRAVVADDEPLARRRVRQLADQLGGVTIVGEAADGVEAIRMVRMLAPDLLFLDIQMPEMHGFEVQAHPVVRAVPALVFLTAFSQFAARAFDVNATDYLLKPIKDDRFFDCMHRVRERLAHQADRGSSGLARESGTIAIQESGGVRFLLPEEIDWIEAADYYAIVHLSGEQVLVRESLESLAERLPPGLFIRTHRSALVNLARVRRARTAGATAELELKDGRRIPVSRRRKRSVLDRLADLRGPDGW